MRVPLRAFLFLVAVVCAGLSVLLVTQALPAHPQASPREVSSHFLGWGYGPGWAAPKLVPSTLGAPDGLDWAFAVRGIVALTGGPEGGSGPGYKPGVTWTEVHLTDDPRGSTFSIDWMYGDWPGQFAQVADRRQLQGFTLSLAIVSAGGAVALAVLARRAGKFGRLQPSPVANPV